MSEPLHQFVDHTGKVPLFHFAPDQGEHLRTDPSKFGQSPWSASERKAEGTPKTFFYVRPEDKESYFSGRPLYHTMYDAKHIYDATSDPDGHAERSHGIHDLIARLQEHGYHGIYYSGGYFPTVAMWHPVDMKKVDQKAIQLARITVTGASASRRASIRAWWSGLTHEQKQDHLNPRAGEDAAAHKARVMAAIRSGPKVQQYEPGMAPPSPTPRKTGMPGDVKEPANPYKRGQIYDQIHDLVQGEKAKKRTVGVWEPPATPVKGSQPGLPGQPGQPRIKLARGMEHLAFLKAIRENPDDHTTRLVFADHLQDNGIPGAHIVRKQVERTGSRLPIAPVTRRGVTASPIFTAAPTRTSKFPDQGAVGDNIHDPKRVEHPHVQAFTGEPYTGAILGVYHPGESQLASVLHAAHARDWEEFHHLISDFPRWVQKALVKHAARGFRGPSPIKLARSDIAPLTHAAAESEDATPMLALADAHEEEGLPGAHLLNEGGLFKVRTTQGAESASGVGHIRELAPPIQTGRIVVSPRVYFNTQARTGTAPRYNKHHLYVEHLETTGKRLKYQVPVYSMNHLKDLLRDWDPKVAVHVLRAFHGTRLQKDRPQQLDRLHGGLGDKKSWRDFPIAAVKAGMKVEREHTNDPKVALEIVTDHLTEDPKYYEKLDKVKLARGVYRSTHDQLLNAVRWHWNQATPAHAYADYLEENGHPGAGIIRASTQKLDPDGFNPHWSRGVVGRGPLPGGARWHIERSAGRQADGRLDPHWIFLTRSTNEATEPSYDRYAPGDRPLTMDFGAPIHSMRHLHDMIADFPLEHKKAILRAAKNLPGFPTDEPQMRLARMRAPAGGAIVNNQFAQGGQFTAKAFKRIRDVAAKVFGAHVKLARPDETPPVMSKPAILAGETPQSTLTLGQLKRIEDTHGLPPEQRLSPHVKGTTDDQPFTANVDHIASFFHNLGTHRLSASSLRSVLADPKRFPEEKLTHLVSHLGHELKDFRGASKTQGNSWYGEKINVLDRALHRVFASGPSDPHWGTLDSHGELVGKHDAPEHHPSTVLFKALVAATSASQTPVKNLLTAYRIWKAGQKVSPDDPVAGFPLYNHQAQQEWLDKLNKANGHVVPLPPKDMEGKARWYAKYVHPWRAKLKTPQGITGVSSVPAQVLMHKDTTHPHHGLLVRAQVHGKWVNNAKARAAARKTTATLYNVDLPRHDQHGNYIPKGWTVRGKGVADQIEKLQALVKHFRSPGKTTLQTYKDAARYLLTDHPDAEINALSKASGGRIPDARRHRADTFLSPNEMVPGSFMFGPKFGPFMLNLHMNHPETEGPFGAHLTADKWWTRLWNRYVGRLVTGGEINESPHGAVERVAMREAAQRAAQIAGVKSVAELQADLWYYEQALWRLFGGEKMESYDFAHGAEAMLHVHEGKPIRLARDSNRDPMIKTIVGTDGSDETDTLPSLAFADHLEDTRTPGAHVVREAAGDRWGVNRKIEADNPKLAGGRAGPEDDPLEVSWGLDASHDTNRTAVLSTNHGMAPDAPGRIPHTGVSHVTLVKSIAHLHHLMSDFPAEHRERAIAAARAHGLPETHE